MKNIEYNGIKPPTKVFLTQETLKDLRAWEQKRLSDKTKHEIIENKGKVAESGLLPLI